MVGHLCGDDLLDLVLDSVLVAAQVGPLPKRLQLCNGVVSDLLAHGRRQGAADVPILFALSKLSGFDQQLPQVYEPVLLLADQRSVGRFKDVVGVGLMVRVQLCTARLTDSCVHGVQITVGLRQRGEHRPFVRVELLVRYNLRQLTKHEVAVVHEALVVCL